MSEKISLDSSAFNSIFVQYSHLSDTFLHKYMSSDRTYISFCAWVVKK